MAPSGAVQSYQKYKNSRQIAITLASIPDRKGVCAGGLFHQRCVTRLCTQVGPPEGSRYLRNPGWPLAQRESATANNRAGSLHRLKSTRSLTRYNPCSRAKYKHHRMRQTSQGKARWPLGFCRAWHRPTRSPKLTRQRIIKVAGQKWRSYSRMPEHRW